MRRIGAGRLGITISRTSLDVVLNQMRGWVRVANRGVREGKGGEAKGVREAISLDKYMHVIRHSRRFGYFIILSTFIINHGCDGFEVPPPATTSSNLNIHHYKKFHIHLQIPYSISHIPYPISISISISLLLFSIDRSQKQRRIRY